MRKTTALACVVALGGLAAAPVFADCQAEIKAAEEAAMKVTDAKQKADADSHLGMARDELARANEKACSDHVAAANAALKTKPAMKTP
jgi:hypothetical protein